VQKAVGKLLAMMKMYIYIFTNMYIDRWTDAVDWLLSSSFLRCLLYNEAKCTRYDTSTLLDWKSFRKTLRTFCLCI